MIKDFLSFLGICFIAFMVFGVGAVSSENYYREKIIVYCLNNPEQCKQEYNYYKTGQPENFKLPEIP